MGDGIERLREAIRIFAEEREWQRFHTPKNLAMALAGEAAELMEPFQWLTPEESARLDPARREAVAQEIGDVLIYLVRLCDVLGIDPLEAAEGKMKVNAARYPAAAARGSAAKYSELAASAERRDDGV